MEERSVHGTRCFVVAVAHARGYPAKTLASGWLNDHTFPEPVAPPGASL
jgi:hypothetical protein